MENWWVWTSKASTKIQYKCSELNKNIEILKNTEPEPDVVSIIWKLVLRTLSISNQSPDLVLNSWLKFKKCEEQREIMKVD